ncbi:class I SAM-dependent methyltransferase [Candidatus Pelagibacter sp.]|nr:class I SAM-dependent methyltransferase [Candidatus Pelagibacter sp.]
MRKIFKKINCCRICSSKRLVKIINLDNQHIQGSFIKPNLPKPYLKKIPLILVLCKKCSLVQLLHTTNKDILYKNYWYQSGVNNTMRDHLKSIVRDLLKINKKKNKEYNILDIGCNDGTLLKFYPKKINKYGIDPSQIIEKIDKNKINTFRDFFPPKKNEFKKLNIKFDIITSIAMFYDLDEPNIFVKEIKNFLKDDGIWVFELSYLLDMLKLNSFDTICHEHLEYYSLTSLEYLMKKHELKIFKILKNDINGGSIRCYVTHIRNMRYNTTKNIKEVKKLLRFENKIKISSLNIYKDFFKRIKKLRYNTNSLLNKITREKKTIHIYGASTKGNTILQWYGIDNKIIKYAADRNKEKWNAKTISSEIQIISEEKSRKLRPDYYFVLPWHFKSEFLKREKKFLYSGGKMIFPLPKLKIY